MTALYVSLSVLAALVLVIFGLAMAKTWKWNNANDQVVKSLALPDGSVSGLLAILVVGAFIVFAFFGKDAVTFPAMEPDATGKLVETGKLDTTLFTAVLTAFGTLTGAVAGFYFGGRAAQSSAEETRKQNQQLVNTISSLRQGGGSTSP